MGARKYSTGAKSATQKTQEVRSGQKEINKLQKFLRH
jgi:hypothetical protein